MEHNVEKGQRNDDVIERIKTIKSLTQYAANDKNHNVKRSKRSSRRFLCVDENLSIRKSATSSNKPTFIGNYLINSLMWKKRWYHFHLLEKFLLVQYILYYIYLKKCNCRNIWNRYI